MSELKFIRLTDIEPIKNYRDTEPVKATDPDVIELADSIKKLGVLQPALVRPKGRTADKYQLIFGHRRHIACGVAGIEMLPCNVQEVADGDILELQVTENLQRKDVHPMDEAIAFQSLIKDKGYTTEDIAARFGKKLEFVVGRLKLNELIPDLQKRFKKNEFSAGQAFLMARLKKDDQVFMNRRYGADHFHAASIHNIQEDIERNLLRQLSSAPWKRDDATLDPKAGPCTTCQKRSGCNRLLFHDIEKDDRCFDKECYDRKAEVFFMRQLKEILETKPDICLVSDHGEPAKPVQQLIKEMKVAILPSGKYQTYNYGKYKKKAKAFQLTGFRRGQMVEIYLEGAAAPAKVNKKTGKVKRTAADIDAEIKGIQERQKRAKELDVVKVQKNILDALSKKKESLLPGFKHQGVIDRGIMIFLLLEKATGFSSRDKIRAKLKSLPKGEPGQYAYKTEYLKALGKLSDDDIAYICREICLDHWGNDKTVYSVGEGETAVREIAAYAGIGVTGIELEQKHEADKRVARADKRIKALRDEKKELEPAKAAKPATKKTTKAPAAKKSGKKGIAKLLVEDEPELEEVTDPDFDLGEDGDGED
jgi:ParB/RepB/Spo0J family partition protein